MREERKKPPWPCIVALLIRLPVLYLASFGPACWLSRRKIISDYHVWFVYRPVVIAMWDGPPWMFKGIDGYTRFWAGFGATFGVNVCEFATRQ
jgi:hypothetical protein